MTQLRNSASPDFWEGLGRQLCRLVSLLSFSLLFSLLHFQETPEKNSARHVFHSEAGPLPLGVTQACA